MRSHDPVAVIDDLFEHVLELVGFGLREEADLAEVDPEDRDVDLFERMDRAQECPVATKHDESIRRRQMRQEGRQVARLSPPVVDPAALGTRRRPAR